MLIVSWFVCIFIWEVFFLLVMYSMELFVLVNCFEICSSNVDLLIFGLLLIKISEFGIILLFKIWLNFFSLVLICGVLVSDIFLSCCGLVDLFVKFICDLWFGFVLKCFLVSVFYLL